MRKRALVYIATFVIFLCFILCIFYESKGNAEGEILSFTVNNGYEGERQKITYYDDGAGTYYLFLPSYASQSDIELICDEHALVLIDQKEYRNGDTLSELSLNQEYDLSIDGQKNKFVLLKSENVATMFLETYSGNTKKLNRDKKHIEYVDIQLITDDGDVDYTGKLGKLNMRGNSSSFLDKKPYNLKLEEEASILGMEPAKEWTLLSNSYDESAIRNKIVYEFAKDVAPRDNWAPDSKYADLYINGDYVGIYLISEKVESIANDIITDDDKTFFSVTSKDYKIDDVSRSVKLSDDSYVEVDAKEKMKNEAFTQFKNYITEFDDMTKECKDNVFSFIDIDSFARKYLIEEAFANLDGGIDSQYYYLDLEDNKLYAGPCWDYDLILGNSMYIAFWSPDSLWVHRDTSNSWLSRLYNNSYFYEYATKLYRDEYSEPLHELADNGIYELLKETEAARKSDRLRWKKIYDPDYDDEYIVDFFKEKLVFLDSLWIEGVSYHTVTFDIPGHRASSVCVIDGEQCKDYPTASDLDVDEEVVWYVQGTDEVFDFNMPINGDVHLYCLSEVENKRTANSSVAKKSVIEYAIAAVFLASLIGFVVIDTKRNGKVKLRWVKLK